MLKLLFLLIPVFIFAGNVEKCYKGNSYLCIKAAKESSGEKKVRLFQKAIELGNKEALFLLGKYYYNKDYDTYKKRGISYIDQSAKKHYGPALLFMGDLYFNGTGVRKDYELAAKYYDDYIRYVGKNEKAAGNLSKYFCGEIGRKYKKNPDCGRCYFFTNMWRYYDDENRLAVAKKYLYGSNCFKKSKKAALVILESLAKNKNSEAVELLKSLKK